MTGPTAGSLETILAYLNEGGDELQVVAEWIQINTTDEVARYLLERIFENLDPDAG